MEILTESASLASSREIAETVASSHVSAPCYGAPEDVRVVPVIESERELIEVQRQIFLADVVIGADDSALEQRPERFNRVRMNQAANVLAVRMPNDKVRHAVWPLAYQPITGMLIGRDQFDFARDSVAHELIKGRSIRVRDHLTNDIALSSDCSDDWNLSSRSALTSETILHVAIGKLSADVGFVHFNYAHQLPELRVLQGRAQAMAHVESRLVRTSPNHAMDLKCADALFGSEHQVQNFEPYQERIFRILVNRSRDEREAIGVTAPAISVGTFPMPRLRKAVDVIRSLAARAFNALRPAMLSEISPASIFVREKTVELAHRHLRRKFRLMRIPFAHETNIQKSYLSVKCGILSIRKREKSPTLFSSVVRSPS
jgi:hypothetical protein